MKTVELPLFTSYVFVKIAETEKAKVRETAGVVNFVYENGKPAVVPDREIKRIQQFLEEYQNIEVLPAELKKGQRVIISEGMFLEEEGRVIDLKNNKVKIAIHSLGYELVAYFDRSKLLPN